jgi:Coenzyme F420-dependent N5,N10-methylene tetrahydromethanopterin reductase and related flavin-dependent oxidoreductases
MKIGFGAPVAGAWATPGYLAAFSEQAEEAGYASLWTFQRLLVPEGSGMDPVYRSVLDPMVALGFAAARTSRIRLGVAILNLPFVSPAYLAKQATTVDVLSGGRLDLGLGIGWMPEEFAVTGGSTARRGAADRGVPGRAADAVGGRGQLLPRRVLHGPGGTAGSPAGAAARAAGAARRHVPAGHGAGRADRGGLDHLQPRRPDQDQRGGPRDRGGAAAAGRDPDAVRIICRGVVLAGSEAKGPDGRRRLLSGSYEQIREDTAWLAGEGVTELFYDLNWDPQVGKPAVAPGDAAERAGEILAGLAPR